MRSLVALVLLGQILGCTGHPPIPDLHLPRFPSCDDPEIEHAANIAVNYINENALHGYKLVLNIIEKATVLSRGPFSEILFLDLDLLETTCHVISPVPAASCTVRNRTEHAVEGECKVKMLKHKGNYTVISARCHSSPDSAEDLLLLCHKCNLLLPLNNPHLINAANTAIKQFNAQNPSTYYHLLEISRGKSSRSHPGYHVEFAIVITNCSGQDAHDHPQNCHPVSGQNSRAGFCKATVFQHTGVLATPSLLKDEVRCTVFDYQPGFFHPRLTEQHLGRKILPSRHGYTVLDLIHSHNDTHASHESFSAEVPIVPSVAKRAAENPPPLEAVPLGPAVENPPILEAVPLGPVVENPPILEAVPLGPAPVGPVPVQPLCPGKTRFFSID